MQEIQLKSLTERFSESQHLRFELKKYIMPKPTKMERNWIIFTPYGFMKNLRQIHPKDSHMEFTGKNKDHNTTWAKLHGLIGQKRHTVSSKLTRKICSSVSSEQATRRPGKQALGLQFFILRILDNFQLLGCDFSETEPNLEN